MTSIPQLINIFKRNPWETNLNPFHVIGLFLYPLETAENQRFSDVFRGYRKNYWHDMSSCIVSQICIKNVFISFTYLKVTRCSLITWPELDVFKSSPLVSKLGSSVEELTTPPRAFSTSFSNTRTLNNKNVTKCIQH